MGIDLISRSRLKKAVNNAVFEVADTPMTNDYASKLTLKLGELFKKLIDEAEGVDAEPVRHGEWLFLEHALGWGKCSECGACWELGMVHDCNISYCPNCGAKMMDGDQ